MTGAQSERDLPGVLATVPASEPAGVERLTNVRLTDDELLVLDGRCSEKVQAEVEGARIRQAMQDRLDLPTHLAGFVGDVLLEAQTNGELRWMSKRLTYCRICRKAPGYAPFVRGPRRGRPNYDRPLTLAGWDLAHRFVTIKDSANLGGCDECVQAALPAIREALRGVVAQLPKALRAEGVPARTKYPNVRCKECGWEGHEGEVGRLRTLMGDGTYPGKCPSCGVEHQPFRPSPLEQTGGFVVVTPSGSDESTARP